MKIIGLCGGSGSGKTTVASLFSELGFAYINTDEVYHELTSSQSKCLDELVCEFGSQILSDSNVLDRKKLADIVFSENGEQKRQRLNKIAHYHVIEKTKSMINDAKNSGFYAVLIDAPLLFESHLTDICDAVLAVVAKKDLRINRICKRDGISVDAALRRIESQLSDDFLIKNSDYVIVNNGTQENIKQEVMRIAEQIKNS